MKSKCTCIIAVRSTDFALCSGVYQYLEFWQAGGVKEHAREVSSCGLHGDRVYIERSGQYTLQNALTVGEQREELHGCH